MEAGAPRGLGAQDELGKRNQAPNYFEFPRPK